MSFLHFKTASPEKLALRAKDCRRKAEMLILQAQLCEAGFDAELHNNDLIVVYEGKLYFPSLEQAQELLKQV